MSGEGFLDDYANVAHGLIEFHVATGDARWLAEAHRLASLAVELFHDPEHGGFFLAPTGGEELVARRRGSTTTRSRRATRCSPTCSCGSAGSGVTTSWSGSASRCSGSWRRCSTGPPGRSAGRCAHSTSTCRRPGARGRRRRSTATSRGRRSLAFQPNTVVAVGPADGIPLLEGRASSTASLRCTSASDSSAGRRSPTRLKHSRGSKADSSAEVRSAGAPSHTLARMTTIEQTGAEEVAWDLSDLYASGDDPRIESDFAEAEAAAAAFRDRYYGKVATLSAADLAAAIDELERIESIATRALYYAHMEFSTNMADPARGALVAKLGEKGAGIDTKLLFFGLEWAAIEDAPADRLLQDPALDRWRHWLAAQRVFRPYLLTEPEEKIVTEKGVSGVSSWSRLYEEVLGAIRVDLDGEPEPVALETAMSKLYRPTATSAAAPPRPSRRPRSRGCARARRSSTRSCSTSRSTTGSAATRRGSPPATSRTRRRTTPCRRSSMPHLPLRRPAAVLPAEGEAARARPARALRPLRTRRRGRDEDALERGAQHRRRAYADVLGRGRGAVAAVLRRRVDRRSGPARQAPRRLLRDTVPGVHPYVFHELHRRPPPRSSRSRTSSVTPFTAPWRSRSASSTPRRPLTTAETASVFGEALTFKRLLAARTTRGAGSTCSPGSSRTRSRRRSGRSR